MVKGTNKDKIFILVTTLCFLSYIYTITDIQILEFKISCIRVKFVMIVKPKTVCCFTKKRNEEDLRNM